MGDATTRPWCRPELIVLVRGAPEEAVLELCKNASLTTGRVGDNAGCYYNLSLCLDCLSRQVS